MWSVYYVFLCRIRYVLAFSLLTGVPGDPGVKGDPGDPGESTTSE